MRTISVVAVTACGLLFASAAAAQDDSVAELAKALKSPQTEARVDACQKLSVLGAAAESAVPELIEALQSPDNAPLRCSAAIALGAIGAGAKDAVPALIEALKTDDARLRAYVAHSLGAIGPEAVGAAVPLMELITDKDPAVRREARDSLREVQAPRELLLSNMSKILQAATPTDAAAAVMTLAEAGEAAVPGLCEALKDDAACYWAALTLAEIGAQSAGRRPRAGEVADAQGSRGPHAGLGRAGRDWPGGQAAGGRYQQSARQRRGGQRALCRSVCPGNDRRLGRGS